MSLFEFTFTLSSVILGLALTHIAASAHKLALAGRRVRWAIEPVLLGFLVVTIVVQVWLNQWSYRQIDTLATSGALLQVARMMTLYFAAASCLPEPGTDDLDMHRYYDDTRALTFGSLITGLLFYFFFDAKGVRTDWAWTAAFELIPVALYASLIFIRWRPYNIALLGGGLVYWLFDIWNVTLKG